MQFNTQIIFNGVELDLLIVTCAGYIQNFLITLLGLFLRIKIILLLKLGSYSAKEMNFDFVKKYPNSVINKILNIPAK